jgi:hypothetical protein
MYLEQVASRSGIGNLGRRSWNAKVVPLGVEFDWPSVSFIFDSSGRVEAESEGDILLLVEMASLLSRELGLVKVLTAIATVYVSKRIYKQ